MPAPAAANLRLCYSVCLCVSRKMPGCENSPTPLPALLPQTLSALFLASTRGCCSPPGTAATPPNSSGDAGRAAWEGGRAWEQCEAVQEHWPAGDGGETCAHVSLSPLPPPPPFPFCALWRSSPTIPVLSKQIHKAIKYSLDIVQHLALKYKERKKKSPQDFVFTTESKCCQVRSLTS